MVQDEVTRLLARERFRCHTKKRNCPMELMWLLWITRMVGLLRRGRTHAAVQMSHEEEKLDISGTDQRKKRSCSRRPTVASVHRCEQKGTEQKMSRGQIKQTEVYSIMLENLTQRVSQVQKGSPVKTGKGPRWQQSSEIRPDQTGLESRRVGAQSWVLIHPGF